MPWYRIPRNAAKREGDQALQSVLKCRGNEGAGRIVHINFGRKGNANAPAPCKCCGWISDRLCDWIIDRSLRVEGEPVTCSAPICEDCSWSPMDGRDLCPQHVEAYRRWLVETHLVPLT